MTVVDAGWVIVLYSTMCLLREPWNTGQVNQEGIAVHHRLTIILNLLSTPQAVCVPSMGRISVKVFITRCLSKYFEYRIKMVSDTLVRFFIRMFKYQNLKKHRDGYSTDDNNNNFLFIFNNQSMIVFWDGTHYAHAYG